MSHPSRSGQVMFAVYWAFSSYDGNGDPKVSSPVEVKVRWMKGRGKSVTADGTPISIDATVKVDRDMAEGSILWFGRLSAVPSPVTSPLQIVGFDEVYDVKGRRPERTVKLKKYRNLSLPTVE